MERKGRGACAFYDTIKYEKEEEEKEERRRRRIDVCERGTHVSTRNAYMTTPIKVDQRRDDAIDFMVCSFPWYYSR